MGDTDRVLVVGPRAGLLTTLRALGIPFVIWTERARRYKGAEYIHVGPFVQSGTLPGREVEAIVRHGPFAHVLAGTEAAVVTAAKARRALGARYFPYTTVIRCHDKLHMKRYLVEHGVETTAFLDGNADIPAAEIMATLGTPVVVKPRGLSGGRDVTLVRDAAGLERSHVRGRILERFVDAPEVSVESFINHGEILFCSVTEYARKGRTNLVPAGLPAAARDRVLELNRRVIKALNVEWGMTHLEVYLRKRGPLFGEIAVRPPGGYIMELLDLVWGLDAWRAFVAMETDRPFDFPANPRAFAAAVVLHPGAGVVRKIHGVEEIRAHPNTVSARISIAPGDRVRPRTGIGVDVGRVLLSAPTRAELVRAVANVDARFRVDLDPE